MTMAQRLAYLFGAILLVFGIAGFLMVSDVGFTSPTGDVVGPFELNPLQNLAHLTSGLLLILAAFAGPRLARSVDRLLGLLYLAIGIGGFWLTGTEGNVLALNGADNGLHIAVGAGLLAAGLLRQTQVATRKGAKRV